VTPDELREKSREVGRRAAEIRAAARGRISLRQLWNRTLTERIPDDIRALVEKLK